MKELNESCCVVECDLPLNDKYWDAQWKSNTIGWDLGEASPPLVSIINKIQDKNLSILIPGCGSAYEAEYLVSEGFTNITLIDISETAVNILQDKFKGNNSVKVILADFFEHHAKYDFILEQTFFCALPPYLRPKYVWKMHDLLNSKGVLAGLLFNRQFEVSPPFGGSKEEYTSLFNSAFDLKEIDIASNSVTPRANSELSFYFVKNEEFKVNLYSFEGITCNGCKSTITDKFTELEGVKNVQISTDYQNVLIVSENAMDIDTLQEVVSYDEKYKISKIKINE